MWNSPESLFGPDTPQENLQPIPGLWITAQKPGFFTVLASLLILFKKPDFSRYTAYSTLIKYTIQAIAVGKRHGAVSSIFALYLTYLKNAVGKPVANRQENSLFVEQTGKPAEGRGGHRTIKFTQDVNSKVRSPF